MTDKYEEMARDVISSAFTRPLNQHEHLVACIASALRQVEREKERETLERAAKVCYDADKSTHPTDLGDKIRALSTANELPTRQELADGTRHLSEREQEVMSRALKASVKIVDTGELIDQKHSSHETRFTDASTYDEVCIKCGATDIAGGGWGKLAEPCPGELIDRGYARVPRDKLMKLLSSVAGDCYVGKIKEEELVDEHGARTLSQ